MRILDQWTENLIIKFRSDEFIVAEEAMNFNRKWRTNQRIPMESDDQLVAVRDFPSGAPASRPFSGHLVQRGTMGRLSRGER
jgi:hypothetical protein